MGEIAIKLTASWVAKAVAIRDDFPTPDYWCSRQELQRQRFNGDHLLSLLPRLEILKNTCQYIASILNIVVLAEDKSE